MSTCHHARRSRNDAELMTRTHCSDGTGLLVPRPLLGDDSSSQDPNATVRSTTAPRSDERLAAALDRAPAAPTGRQAAANASTPRQRPARSARSTLRAMSKLAAASQRAQPSRAVSRYGRRRRRHLPSGLADRPHDGRDQERLAHHRTQRGRPRRGPAHHVRHWTPRHRLALPSAGPRSLIPSSREAQRRGIGG